MSFLALLSIKIDFRREIMSTIYIQNNEKTYLNRTYTGVTIEDYKGSYFSFLYFWLNTQFVIVRWSSNASDMNYYLYENSGKTH